MFVIIMGRIFYLLPTPDIIFNWVTNRVSFPPLLMQTLIYECLGNYEVFHLAVGSRGQSHPCLSSGHCSSNPSGVSFPSPHRHALITRTPGLGTRTWTGSLSRAALQRWSGTSFAVSLVDSLPSVFVSWFTTLFAETHLLLSSKAWMYGK